MSGKNFLQNILNTLSIKVEKIEFGVENVSLNLGDQKTSIESGDFTISNIYKGETLITPRVNVNIKDVNIPLEDIMPLIEEKLKKEPKKLEEKVKRTEE